MKYLGPALALAVTSPAFAFDLNEMSDLTLEMVQRVHAHYQDVGREQAEAGFNVQSPDWYHDQYFQHMFGMSSDGMVWADNVWPEFICTDSTAASDLNGVMFWQMIVDETPADGTP